MAVANLRLLRESVRRLPWSVCDAQQLERQLYSLADDTAKDRLAGMANRQTAGAAERPKLMDYNTVQRKAYQHAKTTGHRVSVELGYAVTYFG